MPADSVTMESDMKPDQERVRNLLTDTVTLLCKNGLTFSEQLRIEGLLGVSIDNSDVFFVHISEKFSTGAARKEKEPVAQTDEQTEEETAPTSESPPLVTPKGEQSDEGTEQKFTTPASPAPSPRQRSRRESPCQSPSIQMAQPSSPIPSIEAASVKLEPVEEFDDLLIMEEPNQELLEKVARKASMVAGRRRVHSSQSRGHSSSQHGEYSDWDSESGEPSSKRHHSMSDSGENGAYMAMHGQDMGNWPDLSGVGEHSGQVYTGGGSYDMASPGCSTWAAAPSQSQDMVSQFVAHHGDRHDKKNPATNLQSTAVSNFLSTYVIQPVLRRVTKSCAFRLVIMHRDMADQALWRHTAWGRGVVDDVIKTLPGVGFFVSAVTATVSVQRGSRIIYPALAYWVIGDQLSAAMVYSTLRHNPLGATLKLFTQRTNVGCDADRELYLLSMVVKDSTGGFVQRKIETHCPGNINLVNFCVGDEGYREQLADARQLLPNVPFSAGFVDY